MTNSTQESLELKILKELYHKTIKIFGPPGTGKTYTLIEKVLKSYLRKGIKPQEIAYLSFTNKAVNTAVKRAMESFPNYTTEDFSRFKTLHTYCRRYFPEEVFDPKDCTIDFALQTKVIKSSDKRLADDNFMYKDWSLGVYSKARNLLITPEEAYKQEAAYHAYRSRQGYDFLHCIPTKLVRQRSSRESDEACIGCTLSSGP